MKIDKFDLIGKISNSSDDNVDVIAYIDNGTAYSFTFFTIANIASLMEGYKNSGECLHGRYLWAKSMIIVKELTWHNIGNVLDDLAASGELTSVGIEVEGKVDEKIWVPGSLPDRP